MGMDCVAVAPADTTFGAFHANWSGWRLLTNLLDDLGCDLSQFSGSNDGDVVDGRSATVCGETILANVARLRVVAVNDTMFAGGTREEVVVGGADGTPLRENVDLCDFIVRFATFCINSGGFAQH
jgi:hypothetical protein